MKNNFKNIDTLTPLTNHEIIDIQGGGLIYDFFHEIGHTVGSTLRGIKDFYEQTSNPSKLNSGTYYGR
jgi:hypothetical protein